MSGRERGEQAPQRAEIPAITEAFLDMFHQKYPTQQQRYPVLMEMDRKLWQYQSSLYRFIQEEAARALITRVVYQEFPDAMLRVQYPVIDIYSVLCEQKQFNCGEYTLESRPDESKIVRVTPKAIAQYDKKAAAFSRMRAENTGEVLGPLGRMLTYLHVHNPILQGRISQLLASDQPAHRVAATTGAAMLSVIAIQAKQPPFVS